MKNKILIVGLFVVAMVAGWGWTIPRLAVHAQAITSATPYSFQATGTLELSRRGCQHDAVLLHDYRAVPILERSSVDSGWRNGSGRDFADRLWRIGSQLRNRADWRCDP